MENVSLLLPLVKDLLSGIYNNVSDIQGKPSLQNIPTLTLFLEQVAQGNDKLKSTFKLTVGPNTVLTGDEPLAKPAEDMDTSLTCCSSTMEGPDTESPILGPTKHFNVSKLVAPNLLFSSPSNPFSTHESGQDISVIFKQTENFIPPNEASSDPITIVSAISCPFFSGLISQYRFCLLLR